MLLLVVMMLAVVVLLLVERPMLVVVVVVVVPCETILILAVAKPRAPKRREPIPCSWRGHGIGIVMMPTRHWRRSQHEAAHRLRLPAYERLLLLLLLVPVQLVMLLRLLLYTPKLRLNRSHRVPLVLVLGLVLVPLSTTPAES